MGLATSSGDEASNDILELFEFFECVLCFCGVGCYGFLSKDIRDLASGQDLGLNFDCHVALGNA